MKYLGVKINPSFLYWKKYNDFETSIKKLCIDAFSYSSILPGPTYVCRMSVNDVKIWGQVDGDFMRDKSRFVVLAPDNTIWFEIMKLAET